MSQLRPHLEKNRPGFLVSSKRICHRYAQLSYDLGMSASNEQLQDDLSDIVGDLASNPISEYQVGSRRVRRDHQALPGIVDALLKLQALTSPRRGLSVARRTDVR